MAEFDHGRLREIKVSGAGLSKLRLFSKAYPYAFWVWQVPEVNRQGAMVCFRGDCRSGSEGFRDVKTIHWWMAKFVRLVGGIDGLVVQTWELFGDWHDRLTFLPASIDWPDTFRVLYEISRGSVYPRRAKELWGEDRVRGPGSHPVAEIDEYLRSLPPAPREVSVRSLADGLNVGLPADQIEELIATSEQPNEIWFTYRKADGQCSVRHVTVQHVAGESIRALDHKDGKTKNFRLDRITEARYREEEIPWPRDR